MDVVGYHTRGTMSDMSEAEMNLFLLGDVLM